jgi:hypothetical protein
MEYHVSCGCGKRIAVEAEQAGTTIRCDCGQDVPVPSLSKLRTTAGLGAYESGVIDTIRRMLDEGTLPWGETCAESGRPTQDVIQLVVQCERLQTAKDGLRSWQLAVFLFGLWALLVMAGRGQQHEEARGRDTFVTIPLRLQRESHRRLARWGTQRTFRRLLKTVPVYARLLEEYPRAAIRVDATPIEVKGPGLGDLDVWT